MALELSISNKIGLNVDIQNNNRNKGKIYFEYKDLDQLNKIFGSEGDGLPEDILNNKFIRESVRIPMNKDSRSINLSNSVSIITNFG